VIVEDSLSVIARMKTRLFLTLARRRSCGHQHRRN
jgi:hypothetical protein